MDQTGRITYGNPAARQIWAGGCYVGPERFGEYKGWWAGTNTRIAPHDWAAARAIQKADIRFLQKDSRGVESVA